MFLHELPDGLWLPMKGKVPTLLKSIKGSKVLNERPEKLQKDLVCIVENNVYESAKYITNQKTLEEWSRRENITWMIVPGVERMVKIM